MRKSLKNKGIESEKQISKYAKKLNKNVYIYSYNFGILIQKNKEDFKGIDLLKISPYN